MPRPNRVARARVARGVAQCYALRPCGARRFQPVPVGAEPDGNRPAFVRDATAHPPCSTGSYVSNSATEVAPAFERRRARRAVVEEARRILREARRALRRARRRGVSPEAIAAVERAAQGVADLLKPARNDPTAAQALADAADVLVETLRRKLGWKPRSVVREYVESIFWAVLIALVIRAFLVEPFKIPTGSMIPTLEVGDHIFVNKASYGIRIPFWGHYLVRWGEPDRGDVVVFVFPGQGADAGKDFIKRIVAKPGDCVRLEGNALVINGKPVPTRTVAKKARCHDAPMRCTCTLQEEQLDGHRFVTQHLLPSSGCGGRINLAQWPPPRGTWLYDHQFEGTVEDPTCDGVRVPPDHYLAMGDNRDNSKDSRYWGFVPFEAIKGRAFAIWLARDWHRMFHAIP